MEQLAVGYMTPWRLTHSIWGVQGHTRCREKCWQGYTGLDIDRIIFYVYTFFAQKNNGIESIPVLICSSAFASRGSGRSKRFIYKYIFSKRDNQRQIGDRRIHVTKRLFLKKRDQDNKGKAGKKKQKSAQTHTVGQLGVDDSLWLI